MTPSPDLPAPTAPTAAQPTPAAMPQYEFTPAQNQIIDELADAMNWVRLPLLILMVAYVVNSVMHFARVGRDAAELIPAGLAILGAVFYFLLAAWLRKAAEAFTRVTHTSGYDITHLMNGLRQLRWTFGLIAAVVQVFIILFFAFLIVAVVVIIARGTA